MQTNRRLMRLLARTPMLFSLAVLCGFFASALVILQSLELSKNNNLVFHTKKTLKDVSITLMAILLIVIVRGLFTMFADAASSRLAAEVKTYLRDQLMQKLNRLGPATLHGSRSGELVTASIQGVEALDAYFSQYLPQIIIAALLPLTILVCVFPLDWISGLVFLVTAPLIPFFMALVGRSSEAQTKRQWTALSRLGADFMDTLQGLNTLKVLGRSRQYADHVADASEKYRIATMNVLRITFLSAFVLELLATISTAVVAVEIGLRLLYGKILFEQAFFILLIAPEFYLPMRNLGMRYHAGMAGVTAAARIFELLDMPEPGRPLVEVVPHEEGEFSSPFSLRFETVDFVYPNSELPSLEAVDLEIVSGKHYALAGRSGAGKSTLLQLIMRYLEPTHGEIFFNGKDIHQWELADWRRQIAWVPQAPVLFNTSLLENIRLNDPSIAVERVWQALEAVQLADFVRGLPEGLQTSSGEWGSRYSGGQLQRVALARAFIKDVPLFLMDEPTAHLDPLLEESLLRVTHELIRNRTSITIAHRLSTIRSADQVLVCESGRIVQRGRHDQLIAEEGPYRQLFRGQEGTL